MGQEGLEEEAGFFVVRDKDGDRDTAIATCSGIGGIEDGLIGTAKFIDLCQVGQVDGEKGRAGLGQLWLDSDERLLQWLGGHGVLLLGE